MITVTMVIVYHRKSLDTTQFPTEVMTEMDIVMVRGRETRMITIILENRHGMIQMNPVMF
jgi:hypothetical protein